MNTPNRKEKVPTRRNPWMRRLWGAIPFAFFVLLVGIVFVLQSWIDSEGKIIKQEKAKRVDPVEAPVNVVALKVEPSPIRDRISLPAVVNPWVELKVVAEVRGKIAEKTVEEGRQVKKGDLLAVIDERDYRNALASARASYQAAKATHDRMVKLFEKRAASRSQLDDAVAQLETTKAAMENAALKLERCRILAPMDGTVNRMLVEQGQYVTEGDPVADLLQIDRVKVEVDIPESDVAAVRQVNTFRVTVDALGGETFDGTMHYLSKAAQSLARSYRLEIAVDNPDGKILPDMFARVEIVKHRVDDALSVPMFALTPYRQSQAVYVAENDHARRVLVDTGIQEGWQVQIAKGLKPGEKVIVVGQRNVSDGSPVRVLRTVDSPEEIVQ